MRYEKQYELKEIRTLMSFYTTVLVILQMRNVHFLILINIDHIEETKLI